MSKKVWRSAMVAVLVVGFAVGPVGAAMAAPERGEGAWAGWGVELGEWVEAVWGWLSGQGEAASADPADVADKNQNNTNCEGCSDAGPNMDPDG